MDLRILALLLVDCCNHALAGDGNETDSYIGTTVVPLIPLSSPASREEMSEITAVTQHSQETLTTDPLEDSPLLPVTAEGNSSEELVEGGSEAHLSCVVAKRALGESIMKFGLRLLQELPAGPEQPNVMVSPLSLSVALSQLALGAVGETQSELLRTLHVDALPCYSKELHSLLCQLRGNALQVASRLYLKPGFEVKPAFVKESQQMYDSYPAHFGSLEEVNEWVKTVTKGQVTNFLSSLPSSLVLMIINAVHFKGEWQARFDPRFTSTDVFHVDDKHVVNVEMMHGPKYPLSHLIHHELDAQIARFLFKDHKSLLVVMPAVGKVNVSAILSKLNISDLYAQFPEPHSMEVKLPKFRMEYGQELQPALTSMGLEKLFSGANLSRIADGPLLVSSVQHKTSMELLEEGAEAGAATSVPILRWSPSFCVNQPFFFALMDDITQTPVFLGVVNNPSPGAPLELRRLTGRRLVTGKDDNDDDKLGDKMADKMANKLGNKMADKPGPRTSKSRPK